MSANKLCLINRPPPARVEPRIDGSEVWYAIEIIACDFSDVDRRISIADGWTGHDHGGVFAPGDLLAREGYVHLVKDGKHRRELDAPGWFDRDCQRLGCAWFVPMVHRMASGEVVTFREIRDGYEIHNRGRDIPTGTWNELWTAWNEMSPKQ
jgi:hypothetical protein